MAPSKFWKGACELDVYGADTIWQFKTRLVDLTAGIACYYDVNGVFLELCVYQDI